MVVYYIAPFELNAEVVLTTAAYVSPDIEIPFDASGFTLTAIADQNGTVELQECINSVYYTIDSSPVNAGVLPTVRHYAFRKPHVRIQHTTTIVSAAITLRIDVTKPSALG